MPRQPVEYPSGVSIDGRPNIYLAEGNKPFPSPMMDAQLPREGSGREGLGEASSPGSRLLSSPGWATLCRCPRHDPAARPGPGSLPPRRDAGTRLRRRAQPSGCWSPTRACAQSVAGRSTLTAGSQGVPAPSPDSPGLPDAPNLLSIRSLFTGTAWLKLGVGGGWRKAGLPLPFP